MAQDNSGFLWLGTNNGLVKFDGYQYTSYISQASNPNSISNNQVECVAADKQGYIWIGHYHSSSGLERLDPSTGIFKNFQHQENDIYSLSSDTVNAILEDHEGIIWVGTINGLNRFDPKTNRFYHYTHKENDPSSLSCNQVRTIYEDTEGTLWVGTGNPFVGENPGKEGGLNKLDKKTGKFTSYLHNENDLHSLIDNRIRAIFEDSHGNFWVGSAGDGLHKMDRKTGSFERLTNNPGQPNGLSRPPITQEQLGGADDHITFITEDIKGRLWIGTFAGGINVYDPATKLSSYYGSGKNSKEKLPENSFWAACKTKDGLIWIGTWNANTLYKINPRYQLKIAYNHTGFGVNSFAEDNSQTLWMTTNNGLVHLDSNGKSHRFLIDKDSLSNKNRIIAVEKDDNNRLWLSTYYGLYYFDPTTNQITGYQPENGNTNGLYPDTAWVIRKSKGNKLWLASNSKGLKLLDTKTGEIKSYQNNAQDTTSLSHNIINTIFIDSNEDLWVGSLRGLNRLDIKTGHFKRYLDKFQVIYLSQGSNGNLWAATASGLFRYDRNKDVFIPVIDQTGILKSNSLIYGVAEDHQQNIWLNSLKGIVRMNVETNEAVLFGKNHGFKPGYTNSIRFIRQNGDVLCGDTAGYFTLNGQQFGEDTLRPIVNISSFLLNDIVVEQSPGGILSAPMGQTEEIRLNHGQNTFSFGFSFVDFISNHEDTRMLYMLQNYDKNWRTADESGEAYYFSLPPGKYIFKVRAYGANGRSAEKQVAVIIASPWWRTWWAYAFFGLCLLAIIFLTDRIQRKVVLAKERARTREKELAQAKEIEKAYHELKTTQSQLIQSEKMASLGELTAGIAHEIQNPLNFMNNFSEVNKELLLEMKNEIDKGNTDEVKSIADNVIANEEKINHHGKRADAIVKGMLQHSQETTGQKEPTDINALADEYLRLSYHGLRAKDKTFNSSFEHNFDKSIGKINIIPQDIGRVLLNLFNNAFYAVAEKRKLQLNGYEPKISVSTKKTDNRVIISVKDNGNGIPQKALAKIFQPFFTTKPSGQGTGLGLSLSYDIVKAHGGEIKVDTREGEFTEFSIQLPVSG